ncbi:MAG: EamA family transporter RarD [Micropruina sp.]|nr:EamA family transporter RarD [Micropruina sp.]
MFKAPLSQPLAAGLGAYLLWGFLPLFLKLLQPTTPMEVLAHRIAWSFAFVGLALLALRGGWGWIREGVLVRTAWPKLLLTSVLIGINWLIYIWAVDNHFVVEASLGYFINPLVNVVLGVLVFGERLGVGGKVGGALAAVGVLVISYGNLSTVWISLALAASFATYGVLKKKAHLSGLQGLAVESAFLLPLALGYLSFLGVTGSLQAATSPLMFVLLALSGLVTALPLWLFAIAAPRLPFGVLGIMQYLGPTIQFVLGITFFGQRVTASYWGGLILVWVGSAVYLWLSLRETNAGQRDVAEPA